MNRRLLAAFVTILALAALAPQAPAHAGPLDTWYWRSHRPTGNDLNGVAFGNGRFVAVGNNGAILTSRHGTAWHSRTADIATLSRPDLRDVAWGNGRFVAVGDNCTIRVSTDGLSWRKRDPGYGGSLYGVSWCQNRFLAVGIVDSTNGASPGIMLSSPDGDAWAKVEIDAPRPLYDVAYGNGVFVAVGSRRMLTSPDGIAWGLATTQPGNRDIKGLTFDKGMFIAVGGESVLTSTDGALWEDHSLDVCGLSLERVACGGGMFVAAGWQGIGCTWSSHIFYSTDGTTWVPAPFDVSDVYQKYSGVTWGGNKFVSVGGSGRIDTSPDGISWVERSSRVASLGAMTWGGGKFLSVSQQVVSWSADGHTWQQESHPELPKYINSVTYGKGLFVAAGWEEDLGMIWVSPDGHAWGRVATSPYAFTEVKALNGIFLALANWSWQASPPACDAEGCPCLYKAEVYFSLDGWYWQKVLSTGGDGLSGLRSLIYGKGAFIMLAGDDHILISWDAATWIPWNLPADAYLLSIAYGNGMFVGVGWSGPYFSFDGRNWAPLTTTDLWSEDVTFGLGWFVAVSNEGLMVSQNGASWTAIPVRLERYHHLRDVIPGQNSFLAVGGYWGWPDSNGEILIQSDKIE